MPNLAGAASVKPQYRYKPEHHILFIYIFIFRYLVPRIIWLHIIDYRVNIPVNQLLNLHFSARLLSG